MPSSADLSARFHSLELSPSTTSTEPSPALTHKSIPSISGLELDLTLSTALSALINHLLSPLTRSYSPTVISALRLHLTSTLTELFSPSWDPEHPQRGSGFRSLICDRYMGLPPPLRETAREVGINEIVWRNQLARPLSEEAGHDEKARAAEWEAWCDPGTVVWRYGGWEWEDAYEPTKVIRQPYQIIWQASTSPKSQPPSVKPVDEAESLSASTSSATPARPSHAIPIRAPLPLPAVFAIPPTPATQLKSGTTTESATPTSHAEQLASALLPAAMSRSPSPAHSDASSGYTSSSTCHSKSYSSAKDTSTLMTSSSQSAPEKPPSRGSHRGSGSGSTSSLDSEDSAHSQLLTPGSRPASTEIFPGQFLPSSGSMLSEQSLTIVSDTPHPPRGRDPSPATPKESDSITDVSPTPTVTPYDGGNVTVLGGGVKLGGMGSRPASVVSRSKTPHDRSRSPSVSLASRALSSALNPNGTARKSRTRRRIMPTYLGHLGQPGVGGPVMGAFGQFGHPPLPQSTWATSAGSNVGLGVGVGVGPPPVSGRSPGGGMPRMGS